MKNMLNLFVVGCFLIAASRFAYCESNVASASAGQFVKVGNAGSQFLKIGVGGRGNAMGSAFTSVADDLSSIYWNPAGLVQVKGISAFFSYSSWFSDFTHNFAAVSLPLSDDYKIAISMTQFGCRKIEVTTIEKQEGTGTFYSVNDYVLSASLAGRLTDQFTFGANFKFIKNGFADLSANGFAFDIGTIYETGIQGIKLGFSILNLGTEMNYSGTDLNTTKKLYLNLNAAPLDAQYLTSSYSLPLTFRAGISSEVIKEENNSVIVAGDFTTFSDVSEQFSIGAEWTWKNLISLRGGYLFGQNQFGLSFGAGLKYEGAFNGVFDYAACPTKDLGLVHRISIGIGVK